MDYDRVTMKVAIIGYGSMGREVEKVLRDRGHEVSARVDPVQQGADAKALTEEIARDSDMAIEFSHAEAVLENARAYVRARAQRRGGHHGLVRQAGRAEEASCERSKIGYLYGSNFSIGAHLFFALAAAATELANPCPEYDIMGWEVHHKRKKDSPSGTALTLARIVTGNERPKEEGRHRAA